MVETIEFELKQNLDFPIEVDAICPDVIAGKSIDEIKVLPAYEGKVVRKLADFFNISGSVGKEPSSVKIIVKNSSKKVKRIGERMSDGEIVIHGDAGMHVGDMMTGGKITINGDADHYAGVNMKGGILSVSGNAGNYLGGAYRGDWRGMSGGKIIVEGNAGFEIGAWMRGTKKTRENGEPLIHVKGNCGLHPGHHNHGGFIIIEGDCKGKAGSEMGRGDVAVLGKTEILASFVKTDETASEIPAINIKGPFTIYKGDTGVGGKGKLYVK